MLLMIRHRHNWRMDELHNYDYRNKTRKESMWKGWMMAKLPDKFEFVIIDEDGNEHNITAAVSNVKIRRDEDIIDFPPPIPQSYNFSFQVDIDPIDVLILIPPRNDARLS